MERLDSTIDTLSQYWKDVPEKRPWWLDETGIPVKPTLEGELLKAATTIKKITSSRYNRIENYTWFIFRHLAASAKDPGDNYLALDEIGRVRPVVLAYNTAVHMLRGSKPVKKINFDPSVEAYLFQKEAEKVLVLWGKEEGRVQFVKVGLSAPVKEIRSLSMLGTPKILKVEKNECRVLCDANPLFLVSDKCDFTSFIKEEMLEYPDRIVLSGGEKTFCQIKIKNIFNEKIQGRLFIIPQSELEIMPNEKEYCLDPGKTSPMEITLSAKEPFHGIRYVPVKLFLDNINLQFSSILEVVNALPARFITYTIKADGDLADWKINPFTVLDKYDSVRDLRVGEGAKELHWTGPDDLSARVYLAWGQDNLYIGVSVTDDVFHFADQPDLIWSGDSLQIALAYKLGQGAEEDQFGLSLMSGKPSFYSWKGELKPENLQYSVKSSGNELVYELAIPFKNLNLNPSDKNAILLSILVNDNDGRGRKTVLEWGQGIWKRGPVDLLNPVILSR